MGCTCLVNNIKEEFIKIKEIGNPGGICHSFLVKSKKTNEECVYKKINISCSNSECKKYLNNIEILKKLNHPNIIQFICAYNCDSKEVKNYLNVFTEYADGGDLQTKLNEQKKNNQYFEENFLLNWFMQICLALKFIHKKKILHRDIKPSNIFLMKQNTSNFAKLGYFNVAKEFTSGLNYAKTRVATLQYSAPEIINGKEYSYAADIWSLGVTFYQLLTLNYPFEGITDEEIEKNILDGKKKEIPEDCKYDPKFIDLINEMLNIRQEERPSAEEILHKDIIKTRMECYLRENGFDLKSSQNVIDKYDKEQNEINDFYSRRKIIVIDDEVFLLSKEEGELNKINKENEAKRAKKAFYDLYRQMTIIKETIKKSRTFDK